MSIELNYGIMCFFKHSNYIMNQIAHSFYNNQGINIAIQNSISAYSGSKNYLNWIRFVLKIWTPTRTSFTSNKIKVNLLTWL